jgi:hypothetical protein
MTTLDSRNRLPIVLNGVHYEMDVKHYRRNTIETTRLQQDQGAESSEQTLNNQYLWKRSGDDFGEGHGQLWFDHDGNSKRSRFYKSLHINPWVDKQLSLLPAFGLIGQDVWPGSWSAEPTPDVLYNGDRKWMVNLDGTALCFSTGFTGVAGTWTGQPGWQMQAVPYSAGYTGFRFGPGVRGGAMIPVGTRCLSASSPTTGPNYGKRIQSLQSDGSSVYCTFDGLSLVYVMTRDGNAFVIGRDGTSSYRWDTVGLPGTQYRDVLVVGPRVLARVEGATDTSLVEVTADNHTVIATWPDRTAPIFTSAIGGPDGIYLSATNNLKSDRTSLKGQHTAIYRCSPQNDGSGMLSAPTLITSLPNGEVINLMYQYSGYILIGTTLGFRLANFTATGGLTYGPLAAVGGASYRQGFDYTNHYFYGGVESFDGSGQYVWFNWDNYNYSGTTLHSGLGRIDLGQLVNELAPAYASDLMRLDNAITTTTPFTGMRCCAVTLVGDQPNVIFSNSTGMTWADPYYTEHYGYVQTGHIEFTTAEQKRFVRLDASGTTVNGTIGFSVTSTGNSMPSTGTLSGGVSPSSFTLTNHSGQYADIEITLTAGSAVPVYDTSLPRILWNTLYYESPILNRWTLRAIPAPERQEEIFVPIILKDNVTHHFGSPVGLDGYAEYQILRALVESRVPVPLVMGSEIITVIVDNLITGMDQGVSQDRWNNDETWPEGMWFVRCITIATTVPTATPTVYVTYDVTTKLSLTGGTMTGPINIAVVAAPADSSLAAGQVALWLDATNGAAKLMIKAKQADGTVRTGSVTLT